MLSQYLKIKVNGINIQAVKDGKFTCCYLNTVKNRVYKIVPTK